MVETVPDLQIWFNTFIMIGGFTAVGSIIYKISQKFSITEIKLNDHEKQLTMIDKKLEIYRLEQKENLLHEKDSLNTRLADMRTVGAKDHETEKLEHKDIYTKIATVNEQVAINRAVQQHTDDKVKEHHLFFSDWIQRVEDIYRRRCD